MVRTPGLERMCLACGCELVRVADGVERAPKARPGSTLSGGDADRYDGRRQGRIRTSQQYRKAIYAIIRHGHRYRRISSRDDRLLTLERFMQQLRGRPDARTRQGAAFRAMNPAGRQRDVLEVIIHRPGSSPQKSRGIVWRRLRRMGPSRHASRCQIVTNCNKAAATNSRGSTGHRRNALKL